MLYLGAKKSLLSSGKSLAAQIAALFASGEQGAWYEPSLTNGTLYQDSAGTTPVTAVGQPVGRMLDKSGRGNHATQPTAINRPILQIDGNGKYYLAFNGTNQWLQTSGNLDLSGTDKLTVVAGLRQIGTPQSMPFELSANVGSNPGSFYISSVGSGGAFQLRCRGGGTSVGGDAGPATLPVTRVLSVVFDIAGTTAVTEAAPRINGQNASYTSTVGADSGTGNFGNYPLYIGARAGTSLFFNGNLHTLAIRASLSIQPEIDLLERFANSRTGAWA